MARRIPLAHRPPLPHRPAQVVALGFALLIAVGTVLLRLPLSGADGRSLDLLEALFTTTSAVCVTGLTNVDVGGQLSGFGQGVVLALIQLGGLGIMTTASLLALLIAGRLRLRWQLTVRSETGSPESGQVRQVLFRVAAVSITVELAVAAVLALRLRHAYRLPYDDSCFLGLFHAVAAFNNAGFSPFHDNLRRFANDPWVLLPLSVAIILGGLGFPVLAEVLRRCGMPRRRRAAHRSVRRRWSLHTRLTLVTTGLLVGVGTAVTCLLEWGDPETVGGGGRAVLNGLFLSVSSRTAGFATFDVGALHPATLLVTTVLMFIGGGSAGTAGGVKVTTVAVLAAAVAAEVRGEHQVHTGGRRLGPQLLRQALTVTLLGLSLVTSCTIALLALTGRPLGPVLFEVVSAFGTVGLSTGLTDALPTAAQCVLVALMYVGRIGPVTLVSALALRERTRRYQLPEERPVIG